MQKVVAWPKNGYAADLATEVLAEMLTIAGEQPIRTRFNRSEQDRDVLFWKTNCRRKSAATRFVDNLKALNQTMQASALIGRANVPICLGDRICGRNKDRVGEIQSASRPLSGSHAGKEGRWRRGRLDRSRARWRMRNIVRVQTEFSNLSARGGIIGSVYRIFEKKLRKAPWRISLAPR